MATLHEEFELQLPADAVWRALRDFGGIHRLAAGFATDCTLEEEGAVRLVTFFNGMQVRERLVTLDDAARRIVYTAQGGRASHHNASAQVVAEGPARCRLVWTTDVLPDALAPAIGQMMAKGADAMRSALMQGSR